MTSSSSSSSSSHDHGKLVISHSGSSGVFALVEQDLLKKLNSIKSDVVYKQNVYPTTLSIVSQPFDAAITKINDDLARQPMLHIFWTDAEADAYRNHVKEQLGTWFEKLQRHNCNNFLVVHASFQDKHALLQKFAVAKATLAERIRNDFGSSKADKTVSFKAESSAVTHSQSWFITVGKIRDAIVKYVSVKLTLQDKKVSLIRDSHESESFKLMEYVAAKQSLCDLFELAGLHEEAYRSLEEVLSLFRQYVTNLRHCQIIHWIEEFIERDVSVWSGIGLFREKAKQLPQSPTSIQLVSVIFARISAQLVWLLKPHDLAKKGLQFLYDTLVETKLLKCRYPRGALVVWVYAGCIELLEAVKKSTPKSLNNMDIPESLAVAKGHLYDLARKKLYRLGCLVGHVKKGSGGGGGTGESEEHPLSKEEIDILIKGSKANSTNIFSGGKQSMVLSHDISLILTDRNFFHKQYIDLCQLSIVSFKQGKWICFAQKVVLEQALYLKDMDLEVECLNAETYLRDVCTAYTTQGWHKIAAFTRVQLCQTQQKLQQRERELNTCCHLATDTCHMSHEERVTYSAQLVKCITLLNGDGNDGQLLLPMSPLFSLAIDDIDNTDSVFQKHDEEDQIRVKDMLSVKVRITNNSLETISSARIMLKLDTDSEGGADRTKSFASPNSGEGDFKMVPIESGDILEDGLYGISLKAEPDLISSDNTITDNSSIQNDGMKHILLVSDTVDLSPGSRNEILLQGEATRSGVFGVSSVQIQVGSVIFRDKTPTIPRWLDEIKIDPELSGLNISVKQPPCGVLLIDEDQYLTLAVTAEKSYPSLKIHLRPADPFLTILPVEKGTYMLEDNEGEYSITLQEDVWVLHIPVIVPYHTINLTIPIRAPSRESCCQNYLDFTWSGGSLSVLLTFYRPFAITSRAQLYGDNMFLITKLTSNLPSNLQLTGLKLSDESQLQPIIEFKPTKLIPQQVYGFVWKIANCVEFPDNIWLRANYTIPLNDNDYVFEVPVRARTVGPPFHVNIECITDGPALGAFCQFKVTITTDHKDEKTWKLLYGVIANRSQWVLSGHQRKQIDISHTATFFIDLYPLCTGSLEYPTIKLWEFNQPLLQTFGYPKDLLFINPEGFGASESSELTALSAVEVDPLGGKEKSRERSTSVLPRAEKVDYAGGKERMKTIYKIVLNVLNKDSINEISSDRVCLYNSLRKVVIL